MPAAARPPERRELGRVWQWFGCRLFTVSSLRQAQKADGNPETGRRSIHGADYSALSQSYAANSARAPAAAPNGNPCPASRPRRARRRPPRLRPPAPRTTRTVLLVHRQDAGGCAGGGGVVLRMRPRRRATSAAPEVLPSERDSLPPAPDDAYSYGEYGRRVQDVRLRAAAGRRAAGRRTHRGAGMERRGSRPVAARPAGAPAPVAPPAAAPAAAGVGTSRSSEYSEYSVYYDDNGVRMSKRAVEAAKAKAAAVAAASAPLAPAACTAVHPPSRTTMTRRPPPRPRRRGADQGQRRGLLRIVFLLGR